MESIQSYTIRNIRESIPRMVLEAAFLSPTPMSFGPTNTLDTAIELAVLRDSVCKDVQVIASVEEVIDLTNLPAVIQPNGGMIITIPRDRTGGRPIIGVTKVCFGYSDTGYNSYGAERNGGAIDNKLLQIVNGYEDRPVTETTRCRMLTPNTMVVDTFTEFTGSCSAVVNLEVGSAMEHIPRTAWAPFSRMALEKAKQLCYNNLITSLGEGRISRGVESDVMTNIISEYSSSSANYNDLYALWRRTEIFLDEKKIRRQIQLRLPT